MSPVDVTEVSKEINSNMHKGKLTNLQNIQQLVSWSTCECYENIVVWAPGVASW
jgi:hypothetical protein